MAAEGDLRKKLKARVEAYGGEIRATAWIGRRSAPDVLCLFPVGSKYPRSPPGEGMHLWVETKAPEKDATDAQAREHWRMRNAGCVIWVINTEAQLDGWLAPV